MSQDQLELVIRPLARKVMDLTLGRYQVLEHHRQRLPEFLSMCAADVENILVAFSKLDVERATSDARVAQKLAAPAASKVAVKAANTRRAKAHNAARNNNIDDDDNDDASEDDPSSMETRARQLEEEDEAARVALLTHDQHVAELKLHIQRLKTTENFLRSTLSDVLQELDHRTTAVDVKAGMVAQRDRRLAKMREAFLRENRQLRDMVAQYRDKGKCDLTEPVLYEWDADEGEGGGSGGMSARQRARGESGGAADPFQQLRAQFKEEKDTLEKGFVKQLEEVNFKMRSLQAQATNAARVKLEQQQQITLLEAQIELFRSQRATDLQPLMHNGESSPIAAGPAGSEGPLTPLMPLPSPRPTAAPPVQVVHMSSQTEPQSPRSHPRSPPPPHHTLEVDPELHDVLVTRQPTPDGLGANIVRSVSTTALASNGASSQQLTPRTSKLSSSSAGGGSKGNGGGQVKSATNTPTPTVSKAASSSKQPVQRVQVQPTKQHGGRGPLVLDASAAHAPPAAAPLYSPVGGAHDAFEHQYSGAATGDSGASPWNDGLGSSDDGAGSGVQHLLLQSGQRIASALESTARTPSQLETFKMLEEQMALDQQLQAMTSATQQPSHGSLTSPKKDNGPDKKTLLAEMHRLRVENEQLRITGAASKVSGVSAPHNNTLLLARLKVDLRERTTQLEERTDELEQLRNEAERWFQVYRQYVPPDAIVGNAGDHQQLPSKRGGHHHHHHQPQTPLVVNYDVVARLKATVNAAEQSEQRYRILSWKVMDHHVRTSLAREGHMHDIRDAHKIFDMALVATLQRQLEMMAHHQQRMYIRLRTKRAESRVESDILWDKVLTMARNVSKLQAVEDNPETPRYYLRNHHNSTEMHSSSPPRATQDVGHAEMTMAEDGTAVPKTSVYFRVVSHAAAAFSLQNAASSSGGGGAVEGQQAQHYLSRIPVRGVAAASPQTLLPQRPKSASATLDAGTTRTANSLPQKLRAAVTRPMSAAMARHGARKPASGGPEEPQHHTRDPSGDLGPFQPSELRNLSGDDRRARILAAMGKDKANDVRNKLQLVEERRMLRASSSATRCPDMSRVEQPVFYTAKLVGRNEPPM